VSYKCSDCHYCLNPSLLKKYEQGKRKGRGYRNVKCSYLYIDPVLQSDIIYSTTCWNARKHDDFCGVKARQFKKAGVV
jgi:hypothetical protein